MPTSFDVTSSTGRYAVTIEPGVLDRTLADDGDRVIIADAFFADVLRRRGIEAITIPADEPAKSLDRMTDMIVALRERKATRETTLVAVGGGVVQDVAAFVASIYMRGLPWIYVPTTLLSMTDSCIGGKSSINVGKYKNIVGTFHPPVAILIDPVLTATLSDEQRAAGLVEAAKICFCRGLDQFEGYTALAPGVTSGATTFAAVIQRSLAAKKYFVEVDEFDRGERLILNFGHTFGHAIEAASSFAVSHGIAVGLGMLAAIHLGEMLGHRYDARSGVAPFRAHVVELLTAVPGLDEALSEVAVVALMDAFESDKKHGRDSFAVILVDPSGVVGRHRLPRDAVSTGLIEKAFDAMLDEWREPHAAQNERIFDSVPDDCAALPGVAPARASQYGCGS